LTHVYNREKAEEFLQNELNRGTRYKTNFSIILVEPENSKNETDSPEKSADRLILADLAGLIKKNIRRTDIVGRWDDEKLIIVLPETNLKQACKAAEKIRNLIISHSFPVTCSFGIASYEESDDKDSLLARAGNALAEAINCGGGKVGYTGIMD
ncbi:MAG: GGDEF domain-containing protein, partial [Clostridiales bacterium]|nr:GGDEF domain-containing protein [Clostridiales bacterium]